MPFRPPRFRHPRPPRFFRPRRPWVRGGWQPYLIDYTAPAVTTSVVCYEEPAIERLPPCNGRLVKSTTGKWCCVEDVSSF